MRHFFAGGFPSWPWRNLRLHFGVDEHPLATYFDDSPGVQGFDQQPVVGVDSNHYFQLSFFSNTSRSLTQTKCHFWRLGPPAARCPFSHVSFLGEKVRLLK